jgi:hypothetical protein
MGCVMQEQPDKPMQTNDPLQEQTIHTKSLTPQAERALAEAAQRRALYDAQAQAARPVAEINGREGPEAIRYGDWENKGIASDF